MRKKGREGRKEGKEGINHCSGAIFWERKLYASPKAQDNRVNLAKLRSSNFGSLNSDYASTSWSMRASLALWPTTQSSLSFWRALSIHTRFLPSHPSGLHTLLQKPTFPAIVCSWEEDRWFLPVPELFSGPPCSFPQYKTLTQLRRWQKSCISDCLHPSPCCLVIIYSEL